MLRRLIALLAAGSLSLAIPTSLTKQTVASSGTFNVISMSVDGLPATLDSSGISDDDKNRNTIYIGMRMSLNNYGIIHVQEDFSYHSTLYRYDQHLFRTETSGNFPTGSGLNTLSQYSWIDLSRIEWNLGSKGFTFMRVRIDEGVYIDMINLDTHAGTEAGGQIPRHSNMQQVADFISDNSVGNAVIVFGNTNSLYTSSKNTIETFTTQNGLTDAWVQAIGGHVPAAGADPILCPKGIPPTINCEAVDKVFYRGSRIINLSSSGFFYDTSRFLSPEGNTLTNQNPIRVDFGWSLKSGLRQSNLYGGPHGVWFNDLPALPSSPKLSSMTLHGSSRLDGISLTLTSGQTFTHGGSGGSSSLLNLTSGEYVTSVRLCWGKRNGLTRNFYAQAATSGGNIIQAGQTTSDCANATAPSGYGVVGTYGQDGDEMDQLGFIYAPQ